ncbi:hypothetical protein ACP70R_009879 [Stipagrostis hirtigluma subsp. patula]
MAIMAAVDNKQSASLLLLLVCVAAGAVSAVNDGPLSNGNFEDSPDRSQMSGSTVTGEYAIPHWKCSGHVEYVEYDQKQGDTVLAVPEGARAVRLGNEASVQQELSVDQGAYYSVTFSAARTCAHTEKLEVAVTPGSRTGKIPIQTVYSSGGWDPYSWAFVAEAAVVSIVIRNPGQEDDAACGPIIDAVAIKTLRPPPADQNNMLKNGDFEEGPYISESSQWSVLVPPTESGDVSPVPGWSIMSYTKAVKYIGSASFAVPRGGRAVELVSGVETALVQEVDTVPGRTYRLEFSAGDAGDGCVADGSDIQVQAYAARESTSVSCNSQWTGARYTRGMLEFTAIESRTRVVFASAGYYTKSDGSGSLCGPVVDDVSLVGVPQPSGRRLLR